jgi:AcrR family transcriptional regulator
MASQAAAKPIRSARKPKGEGHARRGEILAAAERIFVECGYEGATIRKIADEVGLSSTALYMHFRDKSEMLLEICREAFAELMKVDLEIRAGPGDPAEKVRRMLEAYMDFGLRNPNAYRLVFCTRSRDGDLQATAQRLGMEVFQIFERTVGELAAAGRLKTTPALAAQTLWAGVHGIVALIITKPSFPWADRRAVTTAMLDALFDGLVKG